MLDSTDSQYARLARRRARRWRRRARIMGPFLVVPAMLGLLVLSVDLIEYRPAEPPEPAEDRLQPTSAAQPAGPERDAMIQAPEAALSISVVEAPMPAAMDRNGAAPMQTGLPAWVGESPDDARR